MGKGISIDRKKRLRDEPHTGHNRWHPDIPPVIEVEPGEDVTLETRDAVDLQIGPRTTVADLEKMERTVAHPLTGPVYVKGARPGDLLEIEYLDIVPERYGWTRFSPGFGFLPDLFDHYFVVHWDITPEYATSPQLPGVRIPNGAFMGTAGLAPSHEQVRKWTAREMELKARGGRIVLNCALFTYFIPAAFLAVPMYKAMGIYGLLNHQWALILAMITIAFGFTRAIVPAGALDGFTAPDGISVVTASDLAQAVAAVGM